VYDVCSRQSFSKLDAWFEELETYATNTNIVKMLVGNKIDKVKILIFKSTNKSNQQINESVLEIKACGILQDRREVSREEGLKFARKHSMLFIEASAKTKDGVQCAFEELVQKVSILLVQLNVNQNSRNYLILGYPNSWTLGGRLILTKRNGSH